MSDGNTCPYCGLKAALIQRMEIDFKTFSFSPDVPTVAFRGCLTGINLHADPTTGVVSADAELGILEWSSANRHPDTARLDAIEQHRAAVDVNRRSCEVATAEETFTAATLREAIDAMIEAEGRKA